MTATREPYARRGCADSDALLLDVTPAEPRLSSVGRSSADRGRSDCTAAPAPGNVRTRTGGRDGRPAARLLGGLPRHAPCSALRRQCRAAHARIHCDCIPLHRRGVGHGVRIWSCHAKGRRRARLPLGHGARSTALAAGPMFSSRQRRGPSCRPPCRAAGMTTSVANNDQPRNSTSPPVIGTGTSPPLDRKRPLTAE